ncbi:MAG: IS1182 family transposase [Planctomycetia bacterium]|nr:IS1182 family transposase [Planctomycetia bacterium]
MSGFRQPEIPREQRVLWSHQLEDAIPADHPVRLFDELLHSAAFAKTFAGWERQYDLQEGQPPYHPRDLAGLYLYGMLHRLRSSRQLESACYNRLDVIWLLSGQTPDHSTIAAFVTNHGKRLKELFRDVLAVGLRAGLVKLEHVAVDGTKIQADAGRGSVRTEAKIRSWLGHLDEKIAALQAEWEQNEHREATLFGDRAPWSPRGGRTTAQRLAGMQRQQERLRRALAEIARRQEESAGDKPVQAIASTTDPDSRSMKDKEGRKKPNYNGQLGVDAATGMIVAEGVNDAPEDSGQMTPMVAEVEGNCGRRPTAVSADSQYNTGPELARLEEQGVEGYLPDCAENSEAAKTGSAETEAAVAAVQAGACLNDAQWSALPRNNEGKLAKSAFAYDAAADAYRCPAGHSLTYVRTSRDQKKWGEAVRRQYGFAGEPPCVHCPHAAACCRVPEKGRTINRDQYEEHRERLRARMKSPAGRATYPRRKEIVEPRFGYIKHDLGVRRFLRRGLEKVRAEWTLVCTAVNVGILLRHWREVSTVL